MPDQNQTFSAILEQFKECYDLHTVFDDFLTLLLCPLFTNSESGSQGDSLLYHRTIAKYDKGAMHEHFAPAFSELMYEVIARKLTQESTDALGEFYEKSVLGEMTFLPWTVCQLTALQAKEDSRLKQKDRPIDLFVHDCHSGRMLIALAGAIGKCLSPL